LIADNWNLFHDEYWLKVPGWNVRAVSMQYQIACALADGAIPCADPLCAQVLPLPHS